MYLCFDINSKDKKYIFQLIVKLKVLPQIILSRTFTHILILLKTVTIFVSYFIPYLKDKNNSYSFNYKVYSFPSIYHPNNLSDILILL